MCNIIFNGFYYDEKHIQYTCMVGIHYIQYNICSGYTLKTFMAL